MNCGALSHGGGGMDAAAYATSRTTTPPTTWQFGHSVLVSSTASATSGVTSQWWSQLTHSSVAIVPSGRSCSVSLSAAIDVLTTYPLRNDVCLYAIPRGRCRQSTPTEVKRDGGAKTRTFDTGIMRDVGKARHCMVNP